MFKVTTFTFEALTELIHSYTKNIMSKFIPIVVGHTNARLTSVNYYLLVRLPFFSNWGKAIEFICLGFGDGENMLQFIFSNMFYSIVI